MNLGTQPKISNDSYTFMQNTIETILRKQYNIDIEMFVGNVGAINDFAVKTKLFYNASEV